MENKILESIGYILPSLVTGAIAYFMFNAFVKKQNFEKELELLGQKKKKSLSVKLQAYERMLLFCERINPVKILIRIKPISTDTQSYTQLLIANIEQEFEHNLVQQIYISNDAWLTVCTAKNVVINKLRQIAENSTCANDLRENILINYSKNIPPTQTAISFIKRDVEKIL